MKTRRRRKRMADISKNEVSHVKEPLVRIAKRDQMPLWQSLLVRVLAIVAALLFCGILCFVLIDVNPIKFYSTMIDGVFGSERRIWKMIKDLAVLLCISLAVTPAFKMRFWNIGAEGQVLMSCLASVACVIYFGESLSNGMLLVVMFLAAVFTGALWAVIPAIFKAKWNTNETLFTLMMNYIATSLVSYFLIVWVPSGSSTLGELKTGHLPNIYNRYLVLVIVVALVTVAMFIYLKYSKHGYEISVVGESQKTACYIGVNVKKVIIRTLIVSGAICGLAGFLIVSALDHSVTTASAGGQGFTAIMVSWLAKFNPFIMIVTSFLLVFLQQGADQVASNFGISNAFPSVITGIILFFVIGCEFFINYRLIFRAKEAKK